MRTPWLTTSLLLVGLGGCQPGDEAISTEIDDRAIVSFERPLCAGDIAWITRTLDHIELELDASVESPIPVFMWSRYVHVAERCGEGPAGCYTNGEIHGLWQSLEHELVHAVDAPLGTLEPLWDEGIAEAISGRTRDGEASIGSLVGLESYRDVDYGTAGHFMRWLREENGLEGVRSLARQVPFDEAFGIPLDDAIEAYDQNAPWSYPDWNTCDGELLVATEPNAWSHEIAISCEGDWSSARKSTGTSVLRTIDVEEAGMYHLTVHGVESAYAVACQLETLAEQLPDDMAGDIMSESAGLRPPTAFLGDETYEVMLQAGRLQFLLVANGDTATAVFELRPIDLG